MLNSNDREKSDRPDAPLIGADGNIFNLIGIAQKALRDQGLEQQADEMRNRVFKTHSYEEALGTIQEYVNPVQAGEQGMKL